MGRRTGLLNKFVTDRHYGSGSKRGTWHREAGMPTYELQRPGGWKTQAIVERYAHIAPEGLQLAGAPRPIMARFRPSYDKTPLTVTASGVFIVVPERGIEPPTFSLRMSCSTD
jgi:hypothetical protein